MDSTKCTTRKKFSARLNWIIDFKVQGLVEVEMELSCDIMPNYAKVSKIIKKLLQKYNKQSKLLRK